MNVLQLLLIAGVRRSQAFVPLASVSPRLLSSRRVASALDQEKLVQDMYRIRQMIRAPPTSCVDFSVDGVVLGKVSPRMVDILTETSVFEDGLVQRGVAHHLPQRVTELPVKDGCGSIP
jgi:hypothetical protein